MNKLYTLLFSISIATIVSAQTTHNVTVFNFGFDPEVLTIDQGDIVIWTNTEGFHNVDGNTETFPNNPVAFGNEASSELWTYQFTFENVGNYDYQCAIHPALMSGTVIVQGVNSTDDKEKQIMRAFPVPAKDFVVINGLEDFPGKSQLVVFDITGKKTMEKLVSANEQINVSSLRAGIYLFNLTTSDNVRFTGKILIR
ncbi:T9SS type A sorting domain-containing protein [Cryomorphaceae bacterium 1068]|nr:T9SS type A sorting domain-containing protein [Cryomorphaceae bacterium 1068]